MAFLKKIVCLLLAVKIVACGTIREPQVHRNDVESDPEMEKYLREAVENFREQMKEGIEAIKMPVLDPLELRNLDINVYEDLATINLHIKQITVRDLSAFQLQTINADLENFFLKLKLNIPSARATGQYKLDGKLLKIFPLNGNGSLSINLTSTDISGLGKLSFVGDTLQMEQLDLDLSWRTLEIFLENFLGGGRFSQVLQKMLPNIGKNVFENFKPKLLENLSTLLKRNLNRMLEKPEVKKIIEGIVPSI